MWNQRVIYYRCSNIQQQNASVNMTPRHKVQTQQYSDSRGENSQQKEPKCLCLSKVWEGEKKQESKVPSLPSGWRLHGAPLVWRRQCSYLNDWLVHSFLQQRRPKQKQICIQGMKYCFPIWESFFNSIM